jgi:hypothetical protein
MANCRLIRNLISFAAINFLRKLNLSNLGLLEISFYRKLKLFRKNFLDGRDVILLIKNQHCFFVVDAILFSFVAHRDIDCSSDLVFDELYFN